MAGPDSARPHAEYTRRLRERQTAQTALAWRERLLGNSRVVVFVVGLLLTYSSFTLELFSPWWLFVPLAVFSVLLILHERVTRALLRAGRAVAFYERGLARVEDRWLGTGQLGQRFMDEQHANAADLDLFGRGSLFELL